MGIGWQTGSAGEDLCVVRSGMHAALNVLPTLILRKEPHQSDFTNHISILAFPFSSLCLWFFLYCGEFSEVYLPKNLADEMTWE